MNKKASSFLTVKNITMRLLEFYILWRGPDSNRRPKGYEPSELPTALPHYCKYIKKREVTPMKFPFSSNCNTNKEHQFKLQ